MNLDQISESYVEHKNVFVNFAWKYMAKNATDCAITPFSAEVILSYLLLASEGETRDEMVEKLGYKKDSIAILKASMKAILSSLKDGLFRFYFILDNKIFLEENYYIKKTFQELAHFFSCRVEKVRFTRLSEYHVLRVYERLVLDDCTKMILVNDFHVGAEWLKRFKPSDKMQFYKTKERTVEMDCMTRTGEHNCCDVPEIDAKLVEVKLKGQIAAMVFIIPNQINGLRRVDEKIDVVFNLTSNDFKSEYISLTLPKFHVSAQIEFKKLLEEFGIKRIFTEGKAQLHGISKNQDDLYVNDIIQDLNLEIDEKGIVPLSTLPYVPPKNSDDSSCEGGPSCSMASYDSSSSDSTTGELPLSVRVNRPFGFFIKIKGVIILIGRFVW